MKIDSEEARRIADLAHLEFDDEGLERMAREMTAILSYIDQLREVDVSGVAETPSEEPTPLRDDLVHSSTSQPLVAGNAPAFADGFFVVPRIIGGS